MRKKRLAQEAERRRENRKANNILGKYLTDTPVS